MFFLNAAIPVFSLLGNFCSFKPPFPKSLALRGSSLCFVSPKGGKDARRAGCGADLFYAEVFEPGFLGLKGFPVSGKKINHGNHQQKYILTKIF